jgi:hypothetical protein
MLNAHQFIFLIHLGSLCVAGLGILMADHAAFQWLTNKRDVVGKRELFLSHWIVTLGLIGLVLSGLYLFWPVRDYLLGQPLFWLKMSFVAALIINSFFIEYLMHTASHTPWRRLSFGERVPFIVSGAVSTLSWVGAFLVAITLF